jgi:hypothetical protein
VVVVSLSCKFLKRFMNCELCAPTAKPLQRAPACLPQMAREHYLSRCA